MSEARKRLHEVLGYRFAQGELLEDALTHRSVGGSNNERMEFLGDAILNFIIADELYQRCPEAHEGDLSRLRASLVKRDALAELALSLKLGEYLSLGPGELKSGGQRRASTLADALEAIIGAVYLDGGFEAARSFVLGLYDDALQNLPPAGGLKDPKTRLQEYLQSRHKPTPEYSMLEVTGEAHAQSFRVQCSAAGIPSTEGAGSTRRRAEQAAAEQALSQLGQNQKGDH